MNEFTRPKALFLLRNIAVVFAIVFGLMTILGTALTQQTQAGFDCSGNNWNVSNETDLNSAISCYNAKTTTGDYNITFTQNISLTAITTVIDNANDVALIVDGAEFTIDGQGIEGVRPFTVKSATTVSLQNIEVIGGRATAEEGGGIYNEGHLDLLQITVTGNSAIDGGGIGNRGTLTVTDSTISDNAAAYGGGIVNADGTLIVTSSTISRNSVTFSGGGISNHLNGTITMTNSVISSNLAPNGGGIYNLSNGAITVISSTIRDNSATTGGGGGLLNAGRLTITSSTINSNFANELGGGIHHSNNGIAIFNNSTISGNSAGGGGGIINFNGTMTVTSSTISDNSATVINGGGIYNNGTMTINNSIIANSINGGDCNNQSGTIIDNGHNLVEDNSCGFTGGVDPLLGPLHDNGGSTYTHALLAGSPAIDAGDTNLTTDQRGFARPHGLADDIGAYEGSLELSESIYLPTILK